MNTINDHKTAELDTNDKSVILPDLNNGPQTTHPGHPATTSGNPVVTVGNLWSPVVTGGNQIRRAGTRQFDALCHLVSPIPPKNCEKPAPAPVNFVSPAHCVASDADQFRPKKCERLTQKLSGPLSGRTIF